MGYRGPNGIPKDVPEREQTFILVVQISDSEDEPVTRGIPYNFSVLKSCNRSPWEKDHKSQMVKQILMKTAVLDQGHVRLPH